ncbi:MAG: caspase family protein [Pseudomonadota bacterium]
MRRALPLLLLLSATPAQAAAPHKLALLVAIADYPDESGYKDLDSHHDLRLLTGALRRQGFARDDIAVIQDSDATREGILAGIAALTERAAPGDIVQVHYSGHGHQVPDDDGDELDGYDEVLVAWGAPARWDDGYHGEQHLRDDDLGAALAKLRARLGPDGQLLVTLDSCYSGSATRGADEELPARGVTTPLGLPARGADGQDSGAGFDAPPPSDELAPMVVLSAASHDQLAHETRDRRHDGEIVGGLSLAYSHAMARLHKGESYRALFAAVQAEMATSVPRQTPQIEGAIDAVVLRGEIVEQAPWLAVTAVDEAGVTVEGGTLLGILPGTELAFLPPGTADPAQGKPIATGTVQSATPDGAKVTLTAPAPADKLQTSWAFVTRASLGDLAARVSLADSLPRAIRDGLAARLADNGLVRLTDEQPDLSLGWANGKLEVVTADGDAITWTIEGDLTEALQTHLVAYARALYLRRLELSGRGIDVGVTVVPAEAHFNAAGDFEGCCALPEERWPVEAGLLTLRDGDAWMLRLQNRGAVPAWVTVLDLPSDGSLTQLWPDPQQRASDNELAPGRTQLLQDPCFVAQAPYGNDVIKLLATREPLDLRPILDNGPVSAGTRGTEPGPLELLLGDALDEHRTRGAGALRMAPGSAATSTVVVRVVAAE